MQLAALLFFCVQAGLVIAQAAITTDPTSTPTAGSSSLISPVSSHSTTLLTSVKPSPTTTAQNSGQDAIDYGSTPVDPDAGSSGTTSGSFTISQGALIAIVVVCVCVVIFGVASTILFVIAKRRQWNVRASIARASRRLTGRFGGAKSSQRDIEASRRTGTYFGAPSRPGVKAVMPPGHKRGLVVEVQPVLKCEKGLDSLAGKAHKDTQAQEQTWKKNLWGRK